MQIRFDIALARALAEPWGVLALALALTVGLTLPLVPEDGTLAALAADRGRLPVAMTIQALVLLGAGVLLGRRLRPAGSPATIGRALAAGLGGGVLAVIGSGATGALLGLGGIEVEEQPWLQELLQDPRAVAMLAPWIVVFGPIAEEIFFRGYAFRRFRVRLGFGVSVVLSSLMFALIHANPAGIPVYFVIGAVMAWLCERSRGVVAPCIGHMTVNAVVLSASLLHT